MTRSEHSPWTGADDGAPADVTTATLGSAIVITITGDLDADAADDVKEAIGQALGDAPSVLVLDVTHVDFLDSVGVATLVATRTLAAGFGARLRLAGPGRAVRVPLESTGVWDLFDHRPTLRDAVEGQDPTHGA